MPQKISPITISKTDARRFMLAHHGLWPPRQRKGKHGILDYVRHVNAIQFDPINIVGRNPDLVLQSRVKDYHPKTLDDLLYKDRQLLDGWDKMAAIYPVEDLPFFFRRWDYLRNIDNPRRPPQTAIDEVLTEVGQRGPLSSLDFDHTEKVDWYWGPTKIVRAALEHLYAEGHLGIDHRVNNRRAFDLIERLLPEELLAQPDPHTSSETYQDWHIHRRIGSLGLAHPKSGEYWLGILGVKSKERNTTIKRLAERKAILPIEIVEIPGQTYYIRSEDLPMLESIYGSSQPDPGAAFIAPLDNLIWNRALIREIFDFEYIWEVYKPAAQRQYGYYVLPVIYGDRFIARVDPAFDKKTKILTIQNWWWEQDISPDKAMIKALTECLHAFSVYLDASEVRVGKPVEIDHNFQWIKNVRV